MNPAINHVFDPNKIEIIHYQSVDNSNVKEIMLKLSDGTECKIYYNTDQTKEKLAADAFFKQRVATMVSAFLTVKDYYREKGNEDKQFSIVTTPENTEIRFNNKKNSFDEFIETKGLKHSETKYSKVFSDLKIINQKFHETYLHKDKLPVDDMISMKEDMISSEIKTKLAPNFTVALRIGNIVDSKAHYIGNAANVDFKVHGKDTVAGDVYDAAAAKGKEWLVYQIQVDSGKKIATGNVILIEPDKNSKLAKNGTIAVMHGPGPDYRVEHDEKRRKELLYQVYYNSLNEALSDVTSPKMKQVKIAFPLISSGEFKCPPSESASLAMQAFKDYIKNKSHMLDNRQVDIEFYVLGHDVRYDALKKAIESTHAA